MYRSITLFCLQRGIIGEKGFIVGDLLFQLPNIDIFFDYNLNSGKTETFLNNINVEKEIRGMEVSRYVSEVSKIKEVRQKLVQLQQKIANKKGVVMDGRDIGTVVLPNAELKIFLTSNKEIRAKRRHKELLEKGMNVSYDQIVHNIENRDYQDTHREEDPLRKADDAIEIDNSELSPEEQTQLVLDLAMERL